MRQKHIKFHAAALAIICFVVVVCFMLFGPKEATVSTEEVIGDRYIQIVNATWGKNCDAFVPQAQAAWRTPAPGDKNAPARPAFAQFNNALPAVKQACEHKLACRVLAISDVLKTDPLPSCYKRLTVAYRCFDFDRLWNTDTGQGDLLAIDCHENAKTPKPKAP